MVKILVLGDLHGRKPKIHFKDFDCIIQVGDVCDDRELGKIYKDLFKKDNELSYEEYVKKNIGEKKLKQMEKRSLKRGNEILKYLDSFGKPLFFVPGNWDQSYGNSRIKYLEKSTYSYLKTFSDWYLGNKTNPELIKGIKNLVDCPHQLHERLEINFIGYGLTSGYESISLRRKKILKELKKGEYERLERAEKRILDKLSFLFKKRDKEKLTIFISHNVPYKTKLDKIKNKENFRYGKHFGSTIARTICLKHKPFLCIGGHIHEGHGKDKLGKTTLINAGYGKEAQVLIDLDEKERKIRKIKFYKGSKKTIKPKY